jgi:hypothetical protein
VRYIIIYSPYFFKSRLWIQQALAQFLFVNFAFHSNYQPTAYNNFDGFIYVV